MTELETSSYCLPIAESRQKFASQADPEVLQGIRQIAEQEGRQVQAVIEEALRDYLEHKRGERPRQEVIAHLQASVERHRDLYRRLAE